MSHKLIHQLILLSTFVPFFRLGQCNSYSDGYSMERTSWIPLQGTSANKALLLELQIGNKMRSLKGIAGTECVCAGVGSQGLQFNGTTVPFITNVGPSVIEVPCSYAASNIVGANLQVCLNISFPRKRNANRGKKPSYHMKNVFRTEIVNGEPAKVLPRNHHKNTLYWNKQTWTSSFDWAKVVAI